MADKRGPRRESDEESAPDMNKVVRGWIHEGIEERIKSRPSLSPNYFESHIDDKAVKYTVERASEKANARYPNGSDEQKLRLIRDEVQREASDGHLFDEAGKKVFKNSSQNKSDTYSRYKRTLGQVDNIEEVSEASREIMAVFQQSGYHKINPKLAQLATGLYTAGNWQATIDVMNARGLLSDAEHRGMMYSLEQQVKEGVSHLKREVKEGVGKELRAANESYRIKDDDGQQSSSSSSSSSRYRNHYREAAAVFIGAIGAAVMIASGIGITANVIGISGSTGPGTFVGAILLCIALLMGKIITKN